MKNIKDYLLTESSNEMFDDALWNKYKFECTVIPDDEEFTKLLGAKKLKDFHNGWILINKVITDEPDYNWPEEIQDAWYETIPMDDTIEHMDPDEAKANLEKYRNEFAEYINENPY